MYYILRNENKKNGGFINIYYLIIFFLLIGFIGFFVKSIFFPSRRCGCGVSEAVQSISSINKQQVLQITESGEFTDKFDTLALGNLQGDNIDFESSKYYIYIITIWEDRALVQVIPKKEDFKAYMGGVKIFKDSNDRLTTREVICKADKAGESINPSSINFEAEDPVSPCPKGSKIPR